MSQSYVPEDEKLSIIVKKKEGGKPFGLCPFDECVLV